MARESLKQLRADLVARTDLKGHAFCSAYSAAADEWLRSVTFDASGGDLEGLALIAVGGYGRGQLFPSSDLDVTLVHAPRRKRVNEVADAIWYPVWDEGIHLDHSVRSPKEVMGVARNDLRAALGLLDARLVAGDEKLAAQVIGPALEQWKSYAKTALATLAEWVAQRHDSRGDLAYMLEPDLKEDKGGLRDLHALQAAAKATPVIGHPDGDPDLRHASDILVKARVELHRRTGKALDVLLLQEQDPVAEALGYQDADRLMADVAGAARALSWASDDAWRRIHSWLEGPKGRVASHDHRIAKGIVLRDGEVAIEGGADPSEDVSMAFAAAAAAAAQGTVVQRASLERLEAETARPSDPWPPQLRDSLISLLSTGQAGVTALESLDRRDLLVRLVPEWAAVRNLPQRNAFHRFTVDRHLCEAAAEASKLVREVNRPDLLLVGAWLHDIGKGFPGDHTEAGIVVVRGLAKRMGFDPNDQEILVDMVRNHLLLAEVATGRDLDDPATIEMVANRVGTLERLELLAALTQADSIATGTTAWSPWKAGLVAILVDLVKKHLAGEPPAPYSPIPPEVSQSLSESLANKVGPRGSLEGGVGSRTQFSMAPPEGGDGVEVAMEAMPHAGLWAIAIVAPDRPGLFANVAGVLALHNLGVRQAAVEPAGRGLARETFVVQPAFDREPDPLAIEAEVKAVLSGTKNLAVALAEHHQVYSSGLRPRAAAGPDPKVIFDNDSSERASVVEVRASDATGLLHQITSTLAECGLDIVSARVSTLGHEVVDSFYLTDQGNKVTDPAQIDQIAEAVLSRLLGG